MQLSRLQLTRYSWIGPSLILLAAALLGTGLCISVQAFGELKNAIMLLAIPLFYPFLLSSNPARLSILTIALALPIVVLEIPPRSMQISILNILLLIMLISHLVQRLDGEFRPVTTPHLRTLLIALLVTSIVSSCLSVDQALSFYQIKLMIKFVIFYWIFIQTIRTTSDLRLVVILFLIGFACSVLLALLEGIFNLQLSVISLMNPDNPSWGNRANRIFQTEGMSLTRVTGFFHDSLDMGHYCLLPLFLTLSMMMGAKNPKHKMYLGILFALGTCVLFMTFTRGSIIGFLIVLLGVVLSRTQKGTLAVICAFVCPLIVAIFLFPHLALSLIPEAYQNRFSALHDDFYYGGRGYLWDVGWQVVMQHPLFGVGYFNLLELLPIYSPDVRYSAFYQDTVGLTSLETVGYGHMHLDSTYLTLLPEIGFVGLGIFLLLLGKVILTLFSIFRKTHDTEISWLSFGFGTGFLASAINMVTSYDFQDDRHTLVLWMTMAVSTVLYRLHKEENLPLNHLPIGRSK